MVNIGLRVVGLVHMYKIAMLQLLDLELSVIMTLK